MVLCRCVSHRFARPLLCFCSSGRRCCSCSAGPADFLVQLRHVHTAEPCWASNKEQEACSGAAGDLPCSCVCPQEAGRHGEHLPHCGVIQPPLVCCRGRRSHYQCCEGSGVRLLCTGYRPPQSLERAGGVLGRDTQGAPGLSSRAGVGVWVSSKVLVPWLSAAVGAHAPVKGQAAGEQLRLQLQPSLQG